MTTSIISQHNSYDCISTGELNQQNHHKYTSSRDNQVIVSDCLVSVNNPHKPGLNPLKRINTMNKAIVTYLSVAT